MKLKTLSLVVLLVATCVFPAERELDFDFREMEFQKAVESIARLEDRNVLFDKRLENKIINLTLNRVTPEGALKVLLETNNAIANMKNGILYIEPAGSRAPNSPITSVIPLTYVIAKDIEANIKKFIPMEGNYGYSISEQKNAFIIHAPEDSIKQVRKLIEELDQEVTQIFIEAKIIDSSTTFSRQLGIEWGNKDLKKAVTLEPGGTTRSGAGEGVHAVTNNTPTGILVNGFEKGGPLLMGVSAALSSKTQLDALLVAAENNGEARTISAPRITTLNGTAASINSGTTITYKTLVNTGSGAASAGSSEKLKAGLSFTVTPFLVSDDKVRLNINITKSEPGAPGPDSIPTILESNATTSLIVKDGDTATIGGLMTQTNNESAFGVPFLSKIPIIGGLFGNISKQKDDREIIIFMTPTIYKGSRETKGLVKKNEQEPSFARNLTTKEALNNLYENQVPKESLMRNLGAVPDNSPSLNSEKKLPRIEPARIERDRIPDSLSNAAEVVPPVEKVLEDIEVDEKERPNQ